MTAGQVDLYNNAYGDFGSDVEAAVRRETYGEDLGQTSWMTASEWLAFADLLRITQSSEVLEVGSGSGGPAVYLALVRGCRITGVDVNEHGVRNAARLAEGRGIAERTQFRALDASQPLPFADASFDAVVANDAICHIGRRPSALREWHRVLRPGGRAIFTDALVITGIVSNEELAIRSSIGFYLFVPPGENERLLRDAGFTLLQVEDLTENAAEVSRRRRDARARHREALVAREGEANFQGLQRFLDCVYNLSVERRLSRYAYLAEKPRDV
jgi:ubiquinone/menaquinone biosynthesis C-methylase UbiE